jgi:hypothetical protein
LRMLIFEQCYFLLALAIHGKKNFVMGDQLCTANIDHNKEDFFYKNEVGLPSRIRSQDCL